MPFFPKKKPLIFYCVSLKFRLSGATSGVRPSIFQSHARAHAARLDCKWLAVITTVFRASRCGIRKNRRHHESCRSWAGLSPARAGGNTTTAEKPSRCAYEGPRLNSAGHNFDVLGSNQDFSARRTIHVIGNYVLGVLDACDVHQEFLPSCPCP